MAGSSGRHMAAVPKRKHHRRAIVLAVVLVIVLGCAYGTGVWYFEDHFLPHSQTNGHDVSLLTTEALAKDLSDDAQAYTLTVRAGDFSTTLGAQDVGLNVDATSAAADAMMQQRQLVPRWPLELTNDHDYKVTAGFSVDEQAVSDLVASQVDTYNQTATQPQDATVGYSDDTGSYVVNAEVAGTALVPEEVESAAVTAARAMSPSASCGEEALVQPTLRSDDATLNAAADMANQMLEVTIPLTVDGTTKLTVGRAQTAEWITFDENHAVGVDSSAVARYVKSSVVPACAKSDDAHTYSVDHKALTASLASAVEGLSSAPIEVPLVAKEKAKSGETKGTTQTAWNGSGRYIDVDISSQYACLFDDQGNVLWESSIVTGNTSEGRSTPSGTYAINAKTTNMKLVGADEDHDGEPDYVSQVDYWMPFIGNSYGFHDATWRSKFGGTIYKSNGSHGCVNLPHAKAQQLFGLVSVGDKVVIHQ